MNMQRNTHGNLSGYIPSTTPMTLGTVVVLGIGAYMVYKYLYKK
jgi:hypothetical protein